MSLYANPQQHAEKSTTMWTTPETPEQKAYYSTHAAKSRVFGIITTVLQLVHGALAFAAWNMIFSSALSKTISAPLLFHALAVIALVTLHSLFRVTWSTYWYDKLDNRTETDSSIWIPALILVLLLYTEYTGAMMFLKKQIDPIVQLSSDEADNKHAVYSGSIDAGETKTKAATKEAFDAKIKAAALPYKNKIAGLKRRKGGNENEARYIRSQIHAEETKRDEATAPLQAALADSIMCITNRYAQQRAAADGQVQQARTAVTNHNTLEQSRYDAEMGDVWWKSLGFSGVLLLIICVLTRAMAKINVKSGILPIRTYSALDAHGGVGERIWTAISDIWNRQTLQFAVWLHQAGSPSGPLRSFDGTVVAAPSSYNSPAAPTLPPPPSGHAISDEEVMQKVFEKVAAYVRDNPGYVPNRETLARESQKARSMNGSYMSAPWGEDHPPDATMPNPAAGVTHHTTGVSHQNSDAILQVCRQDTSRQFGNIGDGKHNDSTCARNIETLINNLRITMKSPGFTPSRAAMIRMYDYYIDLLPKLEAKGFPITGSPHHFIQELLAAIPAEEEVAA